MAAKPEYQHRAVARSSDGKKGASSGPHEDPKDAGNAARFYADAMKQGGESGTVEIQRRVVGEWETVETRPIGTEPA